MEKSSKKTPLKKTYWAVAKGKNTLFGGSFTECWDWLVKNQGDRQLRRIAKDGIRIARTS